MEAKHKSPKILFVGGDMRQIRAANCVSEHGFEVYALGYSANEINKLSEKIKILYGVDEISNAINMVVLPLPYSLDGENVNTLNLEYKILINELLEKIKKDTIVFAGKCDRKIIKKSEIAGISLVDYFNREDLQILNAIPTAEGAIQIAMEETPYTVHSARCLIVGYGRIGKVLAKMLGGLGADVTVAARKNSDRAVAYSYGFESIPVFDLYDKIGSYDIVFNTVPSLIIDSDILAKMSKNTLVIDLASKPGGVDFESARKMGIKVIWALSLPGKVAPYTAGDIIGKTILNIIKEMEGI